MARRFVLLVVVLACLWGVRPAAQDTNAQPRFEVASIKAQHGRASSSWTSNIAKRRRAVGQRADQGPGGPGV